MSVGYRGAMHSLTPTPAPGGVFCFRREEGKDEGDSDLNIRRKRGVEAEEEEKRKGGKQLLFECSGVATF